jgi:UDP-glucuronate 4-epimerase
VSITILVTGAAGFIGSHVAQALLARGDTVAGLDNLNDYYDPARKRANLAEIRSITHHASRFTFVEGDVRDRTLVARLFTNHRFAAVAHLAAVAGVRVSIADPHLYYLSYDPKVSVTEGVTRFWEWYQQSVLRKG